MYACLCRQIPESAVMRAGQAGVVEPEDLIARFGLTDKRCCGRCVRQIHTFVDLAELGAQLSPAGERPLVRRVQALLSR
jgi:bacterioferritin-associated ferredoxin